MSPSHKLPFRILCALLAQASLVWSAAAATYYVATSGNDLNEGGAADPWQTIDHALTSVRDGDTVIIGIGEFDEWLAITNSITVRGSDVYREGNPAFSKHESYTIVRPPSGARRDSPLVYVMATNVSIESLTLDGDADADGLPDAKFGVYSTNRPIRVAECRITTIGGYGVCCVGETPAPSPDDDDSFRSYFARNFVAHITHTNETEATGVLLRHVAASIVSNEFLDIAGANAKAGVFVESCFYTANMTEPLTIADNLFDGCVAAIDANKFGTKGEMALITRNDVTNAVVGVRLTASAGPAWVTGNRITVGGASPSSNATPARGIWARADIEPWDEDLLAVTDHFISENVLRGSATNADGTVGLCFDYDSEPTYNYNNGVRARVTTNSVSGFDEGARLRSGTNGVMKPHDPLVEIVFYNNDIAGNTSYGVNSVDSTNLVNAISNWWGSVNGPLQPFANPVSSNVLYDPWLGQAFVTDNDNDWIWDFLDPDDDNDGSGDWEESVAGTDPSNRVSVFEFTEIARYPNERVSLIWSSVSNRTYFLYSSTNLLTGPWVALTNETATPPTNFYEHTNVALFPNLYYKVTVSN